MTGSQPAMAEPAIAIALHYAEDSGAPTVVATGRGALAERILAEAHLAGVAIDENPVLAAALADVPLDTPIPEELYQAVAEVISWVLAHGGQRQGPRSDAVQVSP